MATECLTTKVCNICRAEKPLEDFYRKIRGVRGRSARCIACNKAYMAEWTARKREQYLAANPQFAKYHSSDGRRQCNKCGVVKSLELFHVAASSADQRSRTCAECRNKQQSMKREAERDANFPAFSAETVEAHIDDAGLKLSAACDRWKDTDDRQERALAREAMVFRARQLLDAVGG
jgi:hypothetical protein